jgi:hypothetical protein
MSEFGRLWLEFQRMSDVVWVMAHLPFPRVMFTTLEPYLLDAVLRCE